MKRVSELRSPTVIRCSSNVAKNTVCSVRLDVYDMFRHFELELIICNKFAHYEVSNLLNEIRESRYPCVMLRLHVAFANIVLLRHTCEHSTLHIRRHRRRRRETHGPEESGEPPRAAPTEHIGAHVYTTRRLDHEHNSESSVHPSIW